MCLMVSLRSLTKVPWFYRGSVPTVLPMMHQEKMGNLSWTPAKIVSFREKHYIKKLNSKSSMQNTELNINIYPQIISMNCNNKNSRSNKTKDCICIFFPFRFRKKKTCFFTPEVHQPATETSNPTSLPGDKKTHRFLSLASWVNHEPTTPPGKIGILNPKSCWYPGKMGRMGKSPKKWRRWEITLRKNRQGTPKSWRWMNSEDDFPFSIGWVLGLQPIIFQG